MTTRYLKQRLPHLRKFPVQYCFLNDEFTLADLIFCFLNQPDHLSIILHGCRPDDDDIREVDRRLLLHLWHGPCLQGECLAAILQWMCRHQQ